MNEYDRELAHPGNGINASKTTVLRSVWKFVIDRYPAYSRAHDVPAMTAVFYSRIDPSILGAARVPRS